MACYLARRDSSLASSGGWTSNLCSMFVRFVTFITGSVRSRFDRKSSKGSRTFENIKHRRKIGHFWAIFNIVTQFSIINPKILLTQHPQRLASGLGKHFWPASGPSLIFFGKIFTSGYGAVRYYNIVPNILMFGVRSRFGHAKFGSFEVR